MILAKFILDIVIIYFLILTKSEESARVYRYLIPLSCLNAIIGFLRIVLSGYISYGVDNRLGVVAMILSIVVFLGVFKGI